MTIDLDTIKMEDFPLPVRLPALYGSNAYIINSVILNAPHADSFTCEYSVSPSFTQTAEQSALTDSIVQQAETKSVHGLRGVFKEGSHVHERVNTAFVAMALTISTKLTYLDGNKDVIVYEGPLVSIQLPNNWQPESSNADDLVKFALDVAAILKMRNNTLFNVGLNTLVRYDSLRDRVAAAAVSTFVDDEDAVSLNGQVNDIEQAQDKEIAVIVQRFSYPVAPSKKMEEITYNGLVLSELAPMLTEMFGAKDASALLQNVLDGIGAITLFLSYDEEDEEEEDGDDEAEVEEEVEAE